MTLRTREMRRSALVNVPSFSRNEVPGRNTCAYLAVSLWKMSWITRHSSDDSAAVTYDVLESDYARSSPWMYMPLKLPSSAASNMLGMRSPCSPLSFTFHRDSKAPRTESSETWRYPENSC